MSLAVPQFQSMEEQENAKVFITVLQGWGKHYFISQVLTDLIADIQAKRHSLSLVCNVIVTQATP